MVATQVFLILIVAFMLGIAEALEVMESLPLSTQTCRLAGVALVSVILVLLQSKSQGQSTETSETSDTPTESQTRQWWYKDTTGKVHGPFTTGEMKQWSKEGYMHSNLMVRFGGMVSFSPLGALFPEGSIPFTSAPQVPAQTREPVAEEEPPPAWSSDDEQAVIRKWRVRRRAQYKENVCEMAAPVQ